MTPDGGWAHSVYHPWTGAVDDCKIRIETRADFVRVVNFAVKRRMSELIIQVGRPVFVGWHGDLTAITRPLKKHVVEEILVWVTQRDSIVSHLQGGLDFDHAFNVPDEAKVDRWGVPLRHRFRHNATTGYYEGDMGFQLVNRYIASEPPTVEDAGLEPELLVEATPGSGMVAVLGETGSGKSHTLASILRHVMEGRTHVRGNLLTYEAPIEFVFEDVPSAVCIIQQHEIGLHLPDFASAVRNSLRRKPGLVMIGELRDGATIGAGVEAANLGIPVLTTAHANKVSYGVRRLVQKFPAERQNQAFYDVVATTHMLISQRLVDRADGAGKICLREWQVFTDDVRRQLEEAGPERHVRRLQEIIDAPGNPSGRSMRETVLRRVRAGEITVETGRPILLAYGYQTSVLDGVADTAPARVDPEGGAV